MNWKQVEESSFGLRQYICNCNKWPPKERCGKYVYSDDIHLSTHHLQKEQLCNCMSTCRLYISHQQSPKKVFIKLNSIKSITCWHILFSHNFWVRFQLYFPKRGRLRHTYHNLVWLITKTGLLWNITCISVLRWMMKCICMHCLLFHVLGTKISLASAEFLWNFMVSPARNTLNLAIRELNYMKEWVN